LKSCEPFAVEVNGTRVSALLYPSREPPAAGTLILAHGAGAGQTSTFMVQFAEALSRLGVDAATFNFPYVEQRRRIPDRRPLLEACYRAVIARVSASVASARQHLFIGGKSMGGRIATHVAAADPDLPIAGVIALGYPLHPPGRPDQLRDAHLKDVGRPMLVVQGEHDTFGTPQELLPIFATITPAPSLHVVARGDHSFKVARAGAAVQAAVYDDIQRTIVEWMKAVIRSDAGTHLRPH
jgi:predicted alpha/beta-hydrolase family hydrolase